MQKFLDTFEICKRSFISAFPICMTVPLMLKHFTYCINIFDRSMNFSEDINFPLKIRPTSSEAITHYKNN